MRKKGKKRRKHVDEQSRENCSFVVRKRLKFHDDMSAVKTSRNKFYFPLTILDMLGGGGAGARQNRLSLSLRGRDKLKVALFFFVPFLLLFPTSFSPRRCCPRLLNSTGSGMSWHCEFVTFARHRHYCRGLRSLVALSDAFFSLTSHT